MLHEIVERFNQLPTDDAGQTASANENCATFGDCPTAAFAADGGVALTAYTEAQTAQTAILGPNGQNTNQFDKGRLANAQPSFRAVLKTGAAVNDAIIMAGLRQTAALDVATDDNKAIFRAEPGRKQIVTVTPANVQVGDVFTLTVDGQAAARFVASAATVANVTAGLKAAWDAAGGKNRSAAVDGTTVLTLTAAAAGDSRAITGTAVNGGANDTQTITIAETQAGTSATWKLVLSIANVDYVFDTGVACLVSTLYTLELSSLARQVGAWINGKRVCIDAAGLTFGAASAIKPYAGIGQSTGIGTAKTINVYELALGAEL